jgi:redox-sensitive bicupin YhaK (pirin superfamily)
MLSRIPAKQINLGDYGWHVGRFHFSFADYDNPGNTHNVIRIIQDTNTIISEMEAGRQLGVNQLPGRLIVVACLEGSLGINNLSMERGDVHKIWDESEFTLSATQDRHPVLVEMPGIL